MLNRIFSILGAQWLIHQDTAVSYLPVLIAFIKGQDMLLKPSDDHKPYVVAWDGPTPGIPTIGKWGLSDTTIPENSVAVIPVDGVIRQREVVRHEAGVQPGNPRHAADHLAPDVR